ALPLELITDSSVAVAGAWAGSSCAYARRPRADQTYAQLPASTGQYRRFCAESARGAACGGSAVEGPTHGEGGGCSAVERVLQPVGGGPGRPGRGSPNGPPRPTGGAWGASEEGPVGGRPGGAPPPFRPPGIPGWAGAGGGEPVGAQPVAGGAGL